MDILQLKIYGFAEDLGGSSDGFLVDYIINGRSFLEMVRETELPYAIKNQKPDLAGQYIGLSPEEVFLPGNVLLNGGVIEWDGKNPILTCPGCGSSLCWGIFARLDIQENTVTWGEYENIHRPEWNYKKLRPFVFEKQQYLAALQPPVQGIFICPECGSDKQALTAMVETSPNENDPWSSVLQYDYCERCGYPIPMHLGER